VLQTEAVNGTGYFSAVCWLFGRGLFDYLGYPIGMYPVLIHAINLTSFMLLIVRLDLYKLGWDTS
jgi:hypothetical protein